MTYTIIKTKDGAAVVEWIGKPMLCNTIEMYSQDCLTADKWANRLASQPQIPVHPKEVQYFLDNWLYKEMPEGEFEIEPCCNMICTGDCEKYGTKHAIRKEQPQEGDVWEEAEMEFKNMHPDYDSYSPETKNLLFLGFLYANYNLIKK